MALRKHDWGEWSNITLDDIEQAGVTEGVEHEGCQHGDCRHEGHVHEDIVQDEYNKEFFEKFPQFMEAVNDGRIECEVTSDGFLIFYDWKDVQGAQKVIQPDFEPKDEYDQSVFDEYDVEWGFSDEYSSCSECYKVIRTSPDSYSWKADFYVGEYGPVCHECVEKDKDSYIQWLLEAPTDRANTILSPQDLEEIGFEKVEGNYESGWYDRQDSPSEILAKAQEEYPYAEFVFNITSVGQWHTDFELWGRGMDYVDEEEEESDTAPEGFERFEGYVNDPYQRAEVGKAIITTNGSTYYITSVDSGDNSGFWASETMNNEGRGHFIDRYDVDYISKDVVA